jgi:hypothetical protein
VWLRLRQRLYQWLQLCRQGRLRLWLWGLLVLRL